MNYITRTAQRLTRWKHGALSIVLGLGLATFGLTSSASAAVGQLYVSQGWAHVTVGQTLTAMVRLNPPKAVDSVEATLSYNPTKLQYVSVDATGSGFPVELPTRTTSSSVTITRGIFGSTGVSKDTLVARVNFKVLNTVGYTEINMKGNAAYNGVYINPTVSGLAIRTFAAQ